MELLNRSGSKLGLFGFPRFSVLADTLEQDAAAAIGNVVGLSRAAVNRRLEKAHGKTLVANVFEDVWPGLEGEELDVRMLGKITAAEARDQDVAAEISEVTGVTEATVRRRLEQVHGKTLVANVFEDEWPSTHEVEVDLDALGSRTTSEAREEDLAPVIASVTGLSLSVTRRRLEDGHGKTLIINLFDDVWPGNEDDLDEDVEDLGSKTVTEARENDLAAAIAEVVELPIAAVRRRLEDAHGKTLVANVFEGEWPAEEDLDDRARSVSPGQGGEDHRRLQDVIADLGVIRTHHACTDKQLYAGFRPDVAWFRHKPGSGDGSERPFHVFEIERGGHGALAKSVQSLQLAHDKFNSKITLIVRAASLDRAKEMVAGPFGDQLSLCTVERCLESAGKGLARLAEELELSMGTRW